MVTQFGYIAVWSIIWPLAPVFALINDYVELRSDAIKICNHVQRPVGERVESIGPWLNMLVSAIQVDSVIVADVACSPSSAG